MARMFRLLCLLALLGSMGVSGPAEAIDGAIVLEKMIEAAGGREAMNQLGYLQSVVKEEETLQSGEQKTRTVTTLVRTDGLSGMHLQLFPTIGLYCNTNSAWALQNGELDDRPQTPNHARGTINQRVVPILAPFSLELPGVRVLDAQEATWEQQDVWKLRVNFDKNFFIAPVLVTTWTFFVRQSDAQLLAMEVYPPEQFREGVEEGMRYRLSSFTEIDGVSLPSNILVEGLGYDGIENGHFMIDKIEHRVLEGIDPILFVDPAQIQALDESEFPDL